MSLVPQRVTILRRPHQGNYPLEVCDRCAQYAVEDSGTRVEEHIDRALAYCGVCRELTQVASPQEYGWPTFYTYTNGAPVKGD